MYVAEPLIGWTCQIDAHHEILQQFWEVKYVVKSGHFLYGSKSLYGISQLSKILDKLNCMHIVLDLLFVEKKGYNTVRR
jgi:hypothetical protein